jgi:hypothetical protein
MRNGDFTSVTWIDAEGHEIKSTFQKIRTLRDLIWWVEYCKGAKDFTFKRLYANGKTLSFTYKDGELTEVTPEIFHPHSITLREF